MTYSATIHGSGTGKSYDRPTSSSASQSWRDYSSRMSPSSQLAPFPPTGNSPMRSSGPNAAPGADAQLRTVIASPDGSRVSSSPGAWAKRRLRFGSVRECGLAAVVRHWLFWMISTQPRGKDTLSPSALLPLDRRASRQIKTHAGGNLVIDLAPSVLVTPFCHSG